MWRWPLSESCRRRRVGGRGWAERCLGELESVRACMHMLLHCLGLGLRVRVNPNRNITCLLLCLLGMRCTPDSQL